MPEVKKAALVLVSLDEIERIEEALKARIVDGVDDDEDVILLGKVVQSRRKLEAGEEG